MTKAELRKQQAANRKRIMITLVVSAFVLGVMVGLLLPVATIPVMLVALLIVIVLVLESYVKQHKPVKRSPSTRGGTR